MGDCAVLYRDLWIVFFLFVWRGWCYDPEGSIDASILASAGIFGTALTYVCIAVESAFTGSGTFA